jgi:DNA-binding CsgD family transcriptional regulator
VVAVAPPRLPPWPFVGRGPLVDRFLDALRDPGTDACVVLGPVGVGKTRFADACVRAAEHAGTAAVRVTGRRGVSVPLAPLAHLLPADLDLPEPGSTTPVDVLALVARIIDSFRGRSRRPLLVVDDGGLLDPLSAMIVVQLMTARAVFLLVTARAARGQPSGGEAAAEGVAAVWRGERAVRLDLADLSRADVETALHLALGGPVDGPTAVGYWSYSRGNPLALRELVLDALERGVLAESGGVWRLTGPLLGGDRAEALAASRLRGLSEVERELLETLAIAGDLGVADLEARWPGPALEALEERGLIAVRADGARLRVGLAHPLYEQALRAGLSALRARRLRRTVIDLLEAHGARRREDRILCAALRLDNNEPADPALLLRAGWLAAHARDHAQAERLARAAHAARATPGSARLLAESLHELGRFEESLAVLDAALGPPAPAGGPPAPAGTAAAGRPAAEPRPLAASGAAPPRAGPAGVGPVRTDDRVALGLARANTLYWGLGRPDAAIGALAELAADPDLGRRQQDVAAARATLAAYLGEVGLAAEVLPALGSGPAAADFPLARHTVALMTGDVATAYEVAVRSYDAAVAAPGAQHPDIHRINAATALIELGRFEEAGAVLAPVYEAAAAAHVDAVHRWGRVGGGRLEVRRWAAITLGHLELDRGRLRAAERWFAEAAAPAGTPVLPRALRLALAGVAVAAGQRRDVAAANAAVADLDAVPGDPRAAWDIAYDRGRAWAAAATGAIDAAVAALTTAADRAHRTGRALLELRALHDLVRLGAARAPAGAAAPRRVDPAAVAERLAELSRSVRTPLAALAGTQAAAVAAADPVALETTAERFATAGYPLYAAEAAEQAASLFRRQESRRRATAAHNRAGTFRARCEDPATPALAVATGTEPLSRREHEIALLVAAGETNKAISQRLFLSVRTVENHVQRLLTKLDCARRSEVAAALGLDRGDRP